MKDFGVRNKLKFCLLHVKSLLRKRHSMELISSDRFTISTWEFYNFSSFNAAYIDQNNNSTKNKNDEGGRDL